MSIFDIKTLDNRLDRKRKEIIIDNLLDVALKQILQLTISNINFF